MGEMAAYNASGAPVTPGKGIRKKDKAAEE
jgi:hypothetical protein